MRSIAVLWMRFGPYHLARLRGAAERAARDGAVVHGIEVAGVDHYGWRRTDGAAGFARHCLFPDRRYDELSAGAIARAVRLKLDELQPDGVGINGWSVPEARAALAWCRKNGRRAVAFSESLPGKPQPPLWKEWVKSWILRRFDAALVGGAPHREYVVKLGMPTERVFQGYDVVDNDYFRAGAEAVRTARNVPEGGLPKARNPAPGTDTVVSRATGDQGEQDMPAPSPAHSHHAEDGPLYFYANTRLIARKNIDGLLRAYASYRKEVADPWDLVVTGSGEEEHRLQALCSELALDEHVRWPGFVQYEELPRYYGPAGAFVHPARSEPWGLVVNEACASGLPVLVSRTVGAGFELVEIGRNGFLFDPFDVGTICAALVRMSEMMPAERAAMGGRSWEIVSRWGPSRFGEALWAAMTA